MVGKPNDKVLKVAEIAIEGINAALDTVNLV